MKKLQKALIFCLGDSDSIQELILYRIHSSSPLYELLSSLQNIIGYWIQKILSLEVINTSEILSDAKIFFDFTKAVIESFIEDKIPTHFNSFPEKN